MVGVPAYFVEIFGWVAAFKELRLFMSDKKTDRIMTIKKNITC